MMRLGTFSRSLLFALLAGLASTVYLLPGNPPGLGALALSTGYLVATAPSARRGLGIGALAGLLGVAIALLAPGTEARVLGAAFVVGVLRSGFSYRARPLRGLAIETTLLPAGFLLAGLLDGYGPIHTGLAVWGFFLVQSLYFVIGGLEPRTAPPDGIDPFVKAREEALRIMDDVV